MINALIGRVLGPAATLALLAYLAGFPPEFTATYAVLAAYMQFATAPLNPYAEHFRLREILSGRAGRIGAGLAGLALILAASAALVLTLGQSIWVLTVVSALGLGHLLVKALAAKLRSNHHNTLAIALEFTLRPVLLLVLVVLAFTALGPSDAGLMWSFGLAGFATILVASAMTGFASRNEPEPDTTANPAPVTAGSSPWAFIFLGMLMVLGSQFEVFAMSRLAEAPALATYKVALQLASVCGIATNFVLINNLRELYAHPITSEIYKKIFRKVRIQTFFANVLFAGAFALIGLASPLLWPTDTWLLASAAGMILATSAAFGPLANWFYSAGRLTPVMLSLVLMLLIKLGAVTWLAVADKMHPANLIAVYGIGMLAQNLFLTVLKARKQKC